MNHAHPIAAARSFKLEAMQHSAAVFDALREVRKQRQKAERQARETERLLRLKGDDAGAQAVLLRQLEAEANYA